MTPPVGGSAAHLAPVPLRLHRVALAGTAPDRGWDRARELHPGVDARTWTEVPAELPVARAAAAAEVPVADVAAVVGLEVLHRDGGFLLGPDVELRRSLAGVAPLGCVVATPDGTRLDLGLVGAAPGHPVLGRVLDVVSEPSALAALAAGATTVAALAADVVAAGPEGVTVLPPRVVPAAGADPGDDPLVLAVRHAAPAAAASDRAAARRAVGRRVRTRAAGAARTAVQRVDALRAAPATAVQHACAVGGGRLLVATTDGFPVYALADDRGITPELATHGWYDPHLLALLDARLRPGDWFVDVGANIGLFSVAAARRVGRFGRVVAVEPNPVVAELARDNLAMSWVGGRAEVVGAAVAGRRGVGELRIDPHDSGLSYLRDGGGERATHVEAATVDVVTLADVVPAGVPIRLLKVDVEGGEADVLAGAAPLLAAGAIEAVVLEVRRSVARGGWHRLVDALHDLGARGARFGVPRRDGRVRPVSLHEVVGAGELPQVVVDLGPPG